MPGTAVATLRGEGENHIVWVMDCDLLAVDGERLGLLDDRAEVLPGRHTAWVQLWQDDVVNNRSSYLYCAVELEVQGGRDYRLRATQLGPSVSILSGDGIVESVSPLAVDCRETLIELELTQKGILYGH